MAKAELNCGRDKALVIFTLVILYHLQWNSTVIGVCLANIENNTTTITVVYWLAKVISVIVIMGEILPTFTKYVGECSAKIICDRQLISNAVTEALR